MPENMGKCFSCGRTGHFIANCPDYRRKRITQNQRQEEPAKNGSRYQERRGELDRNERYTDNSRNGSRYDHMTNERTNYNRNDFSRERREEERRTTFRRSEKNSSSDDEKVYSGNNGKKKSSMKKEIVCFNCRKPGHMSPQCKEEKCVWQLMKVSEQQDYFVRKEQEEKEKRQQEKENEAKKRAEEMAIMVAMICEKMKKSEKRDEWRPSREEEEEEKSDLEDHEEQRRSVQKKDGRRGKEKEKGKGKPVKENKVLSRRSSRDIVGSPRAKQKQKESDDSTYEEEVQREPRKERKGIEEAGGSDALFGYKTQLRKSIERICRRGRRQASRELN